MSNFKENKKTNTDNKIPTKKKSKEKFKRKITTDKNYHNNNLLLETNAEEREHNFSLLSNAVNKSTLTDIHKINEYKTKITQLEEQIEQEKNISKSKSTKNKEILEIQEKIADTQKQIKLYVHRNNKQREQLQLLSNEIDKKLELIDFKALKKQILKRTNENNDNKTEREIIDINIESRRKQLENIISLIEILEKENVTLINKIKKAKNIRKYYEILDLQQKQENKINELNKEIKAKRIKLKEHGKCNDIKSELLKKIEFIKDEINRNHGKNTEVRKKLDFLENKKKEKQKEEQKKTQKPVIGLNQTNNSINNRNNASNLKTDIKTENLKSIDEEEITSKKEKKNKKNKKDRKKSKSKSEDKSNKSEEQKDTNYKDNKSNNSNNSKNNSRKSNNNNSNSSSKSNSNDNLKVISEENSQTIWRKTTKRNSFKKIIEQEMITIPTNISKIFTNKELKAILVGLDKNIPKFKILLRKYNIQYIRIDSLEARHRIDLRYKLNKINELDEKIEFLNVKKDEIEADIQIIQKKIENESEKKNIYNMKVIKANKQVEDKKKTIERKKHEIKILKNELLKIKELMKTGDMKSIIDEPEIEVQYLDEDEENNLINNKEKESIEKNVETPKTEVEENNDNNFDNIIIKDKIIDKIYPKEEHISGNNSSKSSISL